jgi:HAD superfamily hydrolase (TIGR01509 family)
MRIAFPRKPHAVVFDMDGVIFDTETLYRDALMGAAAELGRQIPAVLYLETIGLSTAAAKDLIAGRFGGGFEIESFWTRASELFMAATATDLRLKPGVIELLSTLESHEVPWAIATSSGHETFQSHLVAHDLGGRFKIIVASGDYVNGKPHPEPFLLAAKRLGVAPELCIALEDSHNGVRSASGAGMMTVMVPDLLPPTDEMRQLCALIARNLHEVSDAIRQAY